MLFWHPWEGALGVEIDRLSQEFNRTNAWGLHVETFAWPGADALLAALQSTNGGQPLPDIVTASGYQLGAQADLRTALVELETYVQDPVWGLPQADREDFDPLFWQQDVLDGKRSGIPALRSASVLYYNRSWAQALGFSRPPQTAAEFEEQACAAARANLSDDSRENDGRGGWIINTGYPSTLAWLYAFGAEVSRPEGGYELNTGEVRQALAFLRRLYEQGCAWLPDDEFVEAEFAARQGLFASGTVMGIPAQANAFNNAGSRDVWMVRPYPGQSGPGAVAVYGPSFSIRKSTPARQLGAWLFVRWLLSPENQESLVRASSALPLRAAVMPLLQERPPLDQWQQAAALLAVGKPEPSQVSWLQVRWAVSDVTTQLFRWYFTTDQLPASVRLLEQTAEELHQR